MVVPCHNSCHTVGRGYSKDCTTCKKILQSACKSREDKHGSDKTFASSSAGTDVAKRVSFKNPGLNQVRTKTCRLCLLLPRRPLPLVTSLVNPRKRTKMSLWQSLIT